MFVPSPAEQKAKVQQAQRSVASGSNTVRNQPPAILGYTMQLSDDKKSALVEFVGLNPKALAFITESKEPGVRAFERGKATKTEIETEFKKAKKDFRIESLQGKVSQ
jgi:hypothetical protein